MLPDSKISQFISLQIPGLSYPMQQFVKNGAVCKVVHAFADYTGTMIRGGQIQEVRKCFTMAGVLYHNGSALLRNAIESVFLYALSPFLYTQYSNQPVKELLPLSLKHIRIQHIQTGTI
jgi:hypothetical protein